MPHSPPFNSLTAPRRPLRIAAAALVAAGIAALVALVLWAITAAAQAEPAGGSRIDLPHLLVMPTPSDRITVRLA